MEAKVGRSTYFTWDCLLGCFEGNPILEAGFDRLEEVRILVRGTVLSRMGWRRVGGEGGLQTERRTHAGKAQS